MSVSSSDDSWGSEEGDSDPVVDVQVLEVFIARLGALLGDAAAKKKATKARARVWQTDLIEVVFEDDQNIARAFMAPFSAEEMMGWHAQFGGRRGLKAFKAIVTDVCGGDPLELADLTRAAAPHSLQDLYVTFVGNTQELAWMVKAFKGYTKLIAALDRVNWSLYRLQTTALATRRTANTVAAQAVVDGAAERDLEADTRAAACITETSVSHSRAQALIKAWYKLDAEYKARGYDQDDYNPGSFDYLEFGTAARVGDIARMDTMKAQAQMLLEEEPLVVFAGKVGEFLKEADATVAEIHDALRRYKDSRREAEAVQAAAKVVSARLSELYGRAAPAPKPMSFREQEMVPSASDTLAVGDRFHTTDRLKTHTQAWALVGAEMKGGDELPLNRLLALERLKKLNVQWGTGYTDLDLDDICKHLVGGKIATNYFLDAAPGANLELGVDEGPPKTPLKDLLMGSATFKNLWEIGKSQASADKGKRGGIEEQMGYSTALNRKSGLAHSYAYSAGRGPDEDRPDVTPIDPSVFEPEDASEMPKYAAVISEAQRDGVAARYGNSFFIWKDSLRERVTHTPGDSWNQLEEGVRFLTSPKHPEVIFAHANEILVRLAAAEATGRDPSFLAKAKQDGISTEAYIETQVHGDLTWADVEQIVIGKAKLPKPPPEMVDQEEQRLFTIEQQRLIDEQQLAIIAELTDFGRDYGFTVVAK
jgi:hypothetical protein